MYTCEKIWHKLNMMEFGVVRSCHIMAMYNYFHVMHTKCLSKANT